MSYCRFSSDNGKSDVYVYHSCYGGWRVHIAEVRFVGRVPKNVMKAKTKKIGLPHDGEEFNCRTRKSAVKRLMGLRELGYHVPQSALDRLESEIREQR